MELGRQQKTLYTVGLFLCLLYFAVINASHGVLLTPLIERYSLTDSSQGLTYSAQNLGGTIALLSSLFIMGRVRKPLMMMLAMGVMALCLLPASLAPSYPVLVGLFVLVGVGTGFADAISSSSIADLYTGRSGVAMMGLLHATFGLGGIVTPLVLQAMLGGGFPFSSLYLTIALSGFAILAFVAPINIGCLRAPLPGAGVAQRLTMASVREYFSDRGRLMVFFCAFFYVGFTSCIGVWVKQYMLVELNGSTLGALTLSLYWVGTLVSRIVAPLLPVHPMRYLRYAILATAALLLVGLLLKDAVLLCVLCALAALLSGSTVPMALQQSCERYRRNTYLATTVVLLGLYLSQMIFPPLVGRLETLFGLQTAMFLSVAAALLAAAAAMLTPVPKKPHFSSQP